MRDPIGLARRIDPQQPMEQEDQMKRLALTLALAASLAAPATVLGLHHPGLPSTHCSAEAAGEPSNSAIAKAHLAVHPGLPLPPLGAAGNSGHVPNSGEIGAGADNCANG
jgi:hypothetical protein